MEKKKILYVEDMEKCYENTCQTLKGYDLDWRKNFLEGINAIEEEYVGQYCAAIFDVNLDYNPLKPNNKQTKEGLYLMRKLRKKSNNLLILCVSSENNKENALRNGADIFMFKKEFWSGKGRQKLEEILKSKSLNFSNDLERT